jgi:hypothetical protein
MFESIRKPLEAVLQNALRNDSFMGMVQIPVPIRASPAFVGV